MTRPLSSHVSYDDLPYDGGCVSLAHPSRIRAIGRLFQLEAPDPATARVLEIGCAGGSNLLPLAYSLPGASFTGVDLSARQIAHATQRAQKLGLKNTDLKAMDIESADLDGPFDYIICHGVYSWVPESVREAILRQVRQHLSPRGIGFISYNALPGWHLRNGVRDMMVYHGRYFPTVEERALQARALVDFVAEAGGSLASEIPGLETANRAVAETRQIITRYPDYYVVHEFLEGENHAFYLHQFVDQVEAVGLQYLGDSNLSSMVSSNLPGDIPETLDRISITAVALEQYRDFLVNRTFKHSLVCHSEVQLDRAIEPAVAREFSFRINQPTAGEQDTTESAHGADGRMIAISTERARGIVAHLRSAYPRDVSFAELAGRFPASVHDDDETERVLIHLLANEVVEAVAGPLAPPASGAVNPTAWLPTRVFAEDMLAVPTRYLQALGISAPGQAILKLLDGTRTEEEVIVQAYPAVAAEGISYETTEGTIAGPDLPRELAEDVARALIAELRKHGALEN